MAERVVHVSSGDLEIIELNLPQQLDFNEFDKIIETLSRAVESKPAGKWIVELTHVEYTGSAVLGMLVNLRQQIKESGGALVLFGASVRLTDILHACSLDRLFKTAPTREAAKKAVG